MLLYQGLLALLLHGADVSLPQEFPPVTPLITFAGVLVLTLIVIRGPLRRHPDPARRGPAVPAMIFLVRWLSEMVRLDNHLPIGTAGCCTFVPEA